MIRLLKLLLALSLIFSPLAGGHAVVPDGASGGIHEMEISLRGGPQQHKQCSADHDQRERNCCELMIGCNADLALRTVDSVRTDNSVSIGRYELTSLHRDGIEFLADLPPPRT
jgi:hypothetical protein